MINEFDALLDQIELLATPEQFATVLDDVADMAREGLAELDV
jgi:hypothetical protein